MEKNIHIYKLIRLKLQIWNKDSTEVERAYCIFMQVCMRGLNKAKQDMSPELLNTNKHTKPHCLTQNSDSTF